MRQKLRNEDRRKEASSLVAISGQSALSVFVVVVVVVVAVVVVVVVVVVE